MPASVAVVIVTYNSAHVVGHLLDSLPAALGDLSAEVVVVDNGSTDETAGVVRSHHGVRLVLGTNIGYAAGLNRGVAECPDADMILVLNPDVVLEPGSVPAMAAALSRPSTGVVAPLVREADGSLSMSLRRKPTLARSLGLWRTGRPALSEAVTSTEEYTYGHVVDWAVGATLLISRECYDAVGGWDESYFLYSEETDFCLRAKDHGYNTWYEPSAESMHIGGASGTSALTHSMQITNRVRLYRRRHGSVASSLYFTLCLMGELRRWVRGHPHSPQAVLALLVPSRRPPQLSASRHLLPR